MEKITRQEKQIGKKVIEVIKSMTDDVENHVWTEEELENIRYKATMYSVGRISSDDKGVWTHGQVRATVEKIVGLIFDKIEEE